MIASKKGKVQIKGSDAELGADLAMIFSAIYAKYGLEEGQELIDKALDQALS